MPASQRTVRLFVSSTFSDMKAERDMLQADVFPRLRQLCLSNGVRFQPIDLRWGVPEEAGKDNRTMRICLQELKRCQEERLKPNFLVLLGDRYGWKPLPEIIPACLFAQLHDSLPTTAQELFEWRDSQPSDEKGWYRRDDNADPPVYQLRSRDDDPRWHATVERKLLCALEEVVHQIGPDARMTGLAIGTSATEQEIIEGILKIDDARRHVHAFFRSIRGLPHNSLPREFVDVSDDGTRDSVAAARLEDLKSRVEAKIGASNVHRYAVSWCEDGFQPSDLACFGQKVYAALKGVILQQIAELPPTSREAQEVAAHRAFGEERCHGFVGCTEHLADIAAFLRGGRAGVLAVVGPSGSGKSALMAEGVRRARETYGEGAVLDRFVGATPESANIFSLLGNLVAEIRRRYPVPLPDEASKDAEIPVDIDLLTVALREALTRPTGERPLFVFLDALDQLAPGNGALECRWLPCDVTPHVRLILSAALPAATDTSHSEAPAGFAESFRAQDPRATVIAALQCRAPEVQQLRLQPLTTAEGQTLIAQWLRAAGRTLQPTQEAAILAAFAREGSPLWLRVATNESRRLASWDAAPDFDPSVRGLLKQVLNRLSAEDEHGAMLVERTLGCVASARHGLAEDEVMDILSVDQDVMADLRHRSPKSPITKRLPVAVWVRLYGDITPYLTERKAQNGTLLGFYHRSFLDAVQAAFLGTAGGRRAAHQRLADFFGARSWFTAPVDEQGLLLRAAEFADPPDVRKVSELPWHLLRVADVSDPAHDRLTVLDAQAAVLCDINFVEAKCRAGLLFELQEDYRNAENVLAESLTISTEDQYRTQQITRWSGEIIDYASCWNSRRDRIAHGEFVNNSKPILPEIVPSIKIRSNEREESQFIHSTRNLKSLGKVHDFARFVDTERHALLSLGQRPCFVVQHAFNSGSSGPVHAAAAEALAYLSAPLLLRTWPPNHKNFAKAARVLTMISPAVFFSSVDISLSRDLAVSAQWDGNSVRLWETQTGQCLYVFQGHAAYVNCVRVTPDARLAISGSDDCTVRVWDLDAFRCTRILEGHRGPVFGVCITPDGRRAVSGSSDGTLRVWDLKSGMHVRTLKGHEAGVRDVSITPDGCRAASASEDRTVRLWNLETGHCERTLRGHGHNVYSVDLTPDGLRAISGSGDEKLIVWDLQNGECLQELRGHQNQVLGVRITLDGCYAVSASADHKVRVWNLNQGACCGILYGHSGTVRAVSLSPDGGHAVSCGEDGLLIKWDLTAIRRSTTADWKDFHKDEAIAASVTSDGRLAVSVGGYYDRALKLWEPSSGRCLGTYGRGLELNVGSFQKIAIGWSGRRAVTVTTYGTVEVWDLETGELLGQSIGRNLGWYTQTVNIDLSQTGRFAISKSSNGTQLVWDLKNGRTLAYVMAHIVLSRIWIAKKAREVLDLMIHGVCQIYKARPCRRSEMWSNMVDKWLEFGGTPKGWSSSEDGRWALFWCRDSILNLWDIKNSRCVARYSPPAAIRDAVMSKRAKSIVCCTSSGEIVFLRLENGRSKPPVSTS